MSRCRSTSPIVLGFLALSCANTFLCLLLDHFINELNGITRLIVYLGTHNAQSTPKHLYFTHLTFLPWQSSHARVGSSVVLNHHDFNEVQVYDLIEYSISMSQGCVAVL